MLFRVIYMFFRALVAAMAFLAAGCASTAKPYPGIGTGYADDPFVPVNVFINPGQHVTSYHSELLNHVFETLAGSGAFVRTERGMQQWPITLVVNYSFEMPTTVGGLASAVVYGGSLGLIPTKVPRHHRLRAEVLVNRMPANKFEYTIEASETLSIFKLGNPHEESKQIIDELLGRLLADLAKSGTVPRARDFQPDTTPSARDKAA